MSTSPATHEWRFPNAATALGSGPYYAVRFAPQLRRDLHAMVLAWHELIRGVARSPTDPGVARLKLDWWRHEVSEALDKGTARHPLMNALLDAGLTDTATTPMHAILDASEGTIVRPQLQDPAAFRGACRALGGNLFRLLCEPDGASAYNDERCADLGTYFDAVDRLCRLSGETALDALLVRSTRDGRIEQDRRRDLVKQLARFPDTGTPLRREPVPDVARRLTAVAQGLHRKLARRGYQIGDRPIERPPIAHLWAAWRCRSGV